MREPSFLEPAASLRRVVVVLLCGPTPTPTTKPRFPLERVEVKTLLPPRVICPGRYRGEVISAEVVAFEWRKSPINREGLALRVAVEVTGEDGQPAHVVDACDINHYQRLTALFRAAGGSINLDEDSVASRCHELIGKEIDLVVKTIRPQQGKHAGRPKSVVGVWIG